MSRGAGTLQRKIIASTGCTGTIWDVMDEVPFSVAHDAAGSVLGVDIYETDKVWKIDGKPWCTGEAITASYADYEALKREFRLVWLCRSSYHGNRTVTKLPTFDPTCFFCYDTLREAIYPGIWGDLREYGCNTRGVSVPMTPKDIKQKRNAANAGLCRAMSSWKESGCIQFAGYRQNVNWWVFLLPPEEVLATRCR